MLRKENQSLPEIRDGRRNGLTIFLGTSERNKNYLYCDCGSKFHE